MKRFDDDSYVNKTLSNYIKSRNIKLSGVNILEFGCRDGSSFISFLKNGAGSVTGIDIDANALELSKCIYNDFGYKNVYFRLSHINEPLPIEKEEFDIISCNAVLEHITPEIRISYLKELDKALKPGGYFIISDTPNKLWVKEGHTTGLFFLNFLPFRLKCLLGSYTKRWKNKIKYNDYDKWIAEGIEGVKYRDLYSFFSEYDYTNEEDLKSMEDYKYYIFDLYHTNDIIKKMYRNILFLYAKLMDIFYLRIKKYPSCAIAESLTCCFRKLKRE